MNKRKSILEKSDKQKTNGSKKSAILLLLMFLPLISTKAWSYAQGELPPSFSERPFSSGDNLSFPRAVFEGPDLSETKFTNETFAFSRAVLTDEKGVAICQVNLVENPEFLPQFADLGSSDRLEPLDLPECKEQSLDIVAQYAQQAWVKKEVAIAPVIATGAISFTGGCFMGLIIWITNDIVTQTRNGNLTNIINKRDIEDESKLPSSALPAIIGGIYGGINGALASIPSYISGTGWLKLGTTMIGTGFGTIGGLACYDIADTIFYE